MTARSAFSTSVNNAQATGVATVATAAMTFQEAINASGANVGYSVANPGAAGATNSSFVAAVKSAIAAGIASQNAAAAAYQVAIAAAKDTLKNSGDTAPA